MIHFYYNSVTGTNRVQLQIHVTNLNVTMVNTKEREVLNSIYLGVK